MSITGGFGALLKQLYDPRGILGSRLGTVSIIPLGTPNALMLVGRAENVKTAIELIQRLDQPIVPTARFEVFPLKHASAAEAKTLIDGFLGQSTAAPTGPAAPTPQGGTAAGGGTAGQGPLPTLHPRGLGIADPRTNSIIVIASPRDITEVAALIARIDAPGAAAE